MPEGYLREFTCHGQSDNWFCFKILLLKVHKNKVDGYGSYIS